MAARKSRTSGARARPGDRPIVGDMLLSQADVPDRDDPPVQLDLPRNFFVIDHSRRAQARREARRRSCRCAAAAVRSRSTIPAPCSGTWAGRSKPSTCRRPCRYAEGLEPFRPRWSGVSFAPRAAGLPSPAVLRRRNGMRVQPEYVFPPDGRQVYYPNSYPWRIVGRIFVWSNASSPSWAWSGSAGLVSRNAILTASHVVPWNSGSNWKALFVPAYYDGTSLYGASAASWVTSARGYKDHGQGDDMAVMRLAQPLGDWLATSATRPTTTIGRTAITGRLPAIPATSPTRSGPRRTTGSRSPMTTMTAPASSSSTRPTPTAATAAGRYGVGGTGKPYVIGTHSGGEDNFGEPKQNVAAGGSALSSLIAWARNNW